MKVGKNEYDLYIGGKTKGTDAQVGSLFAQGLVPERLYEVIDKIIDIYAKHGKKREPFLKFINRFGVANL